MAISPRTRLATLDSSRAMLEQLRTLPSLPDEELASYAAACHTHTLSAATPELRRVAAMSKSAIKGVLTVGATADLVAHLDAAASGLLLRNIPLADVNAILRSTCISFTHSAIALGSTTTVDRTVVACKRTADGWARREGWNKHTRSLLLTTATLAIAEQIAEELFEEFLACRDAAQIEELSQLLN